MDYETLIVRADLRLYRAIQTRPLLSSLRDTMDSFLDPLNDQFEHTTLYSIGHLPFLHGFLTNEFSDKDILEKFPRVEQRPCRRSFHNEVTLARFRMTVVPTRVWAKQQSLLQPDSDGKLIPRCRHCRRRPEYITHLLFTCSTLDYSMFPRDRFEHQFKLSQALQNLTGDELFTLENQLLQFVTQNNLFRYDALTENTILVKRRQPPVSPSRLSTQKKARRHLKRTNPSSDLIPSSKRPKRAGTSR
jgi:hypothetical protein